MNFEESLVMALEHPSSLIKPEYESGPHGGLPLIRNSSILKNGLITCIILIRLML